MKRFRARFIYTVSILVIGAASLVLSSCGGGGGGGGGGSASGNTTISNAAQGGAAAGAGQTAVTAGSGLSNVASSLGSIGGNSLGLSLPSKPGAKASKDPRIAKIVALANKVANSKAITKAAAHLKSAKANSKSALVSVPIVLTDQACTDGGTFDISGTAGVTITPGTTDTTTETDFDVQMTLHDCREDGNQSAGQIRVAGNTTDSENNSDPSINSSQGSFNVAMGVPGGDDLVVQSYNDTTYGSLLGILTTNMNTTEGYSSDSDETTPDTSILGANGLATYVDYTVAPIQSTNLTMTNFSDASIFVSDSSAGTSTANDTLGGGIAESWTETDGTHSVAVGYSAFKTDEVTTVPVAAPGVRMAASTGYTDTSFSGTVSIDFTPNTDCAIEGTFSFVTDTPVHEVFGDSCPTAGHLTLNGNTTVTFNSDSSVDVAVDSGTPVHYATCQDLENVCQIEDFQPSGGQASGGEGIPATGNGMLATLTWDTPTSDMDLHVGYYSNSAPTTGPADALVAWHTSQPVAFGTASAELDFDDVEGLGPEHVTISGLPAGYYVVAVNSFDLDQDANATVNVSVTIGGTVFTFPPHLFTVADGDGTNPAAWYRVTDIQCVSAGNCIFVTPNTNLQVHDTIGDFKPKVKK